MNALWFLTYRSVVNGIRRAVTSARRLIGLAFFVLYYLLMFRPAVFPADAQLPGRFGEGLPLPQREIIDAIVFGGFVFLSLFFLAGSGQVKGSFKSADVDVLFPTPVDPRLVLGFRLIRDTLLTLFIPLVLTLFLYRPASAGWAAMFRGVESPDAAPLVLRAGFVAYLLMTMAWISVGYAVSLYLNRPGATYDRARGAFTWVCGILLVGLAGIVAWQLATPERLLGLAHAWPVRVIFLLPTAATKLAMAPMEGSWVAALIGGGGLIGFAAIGAWACMRQSGWLYEQAAMRVDTVGASQAMARQGDALGAIAQMARRGKVKAGRTGRIGRMRVRGASALLWKEYIIQSRGMRFMLILQFLVVGGMMSLMPALAMANGSTRSASAMFMVMQGAGALGFIAIQSQSGYIEMLRRIDLLKPLPFTPARTVWLEVAAKTLFPALASWIAALVFLVFRPDAWAACLASAILMPSLALVLSALFAVLALLFPDMEDPTQRGFRSLVTMLGLAVVAGPGLLVYIGLVVVGFSPALAAAPVAAVNLGLALLGARIGGDLYAGFNPSD